MHMTTATRLDAEELFHLAVAASDRNDAASAIDLLKQAIEADPTAAKAHYLLGAEHAQIGLFDRAIADMSKAVELDSELDAARFQLGLLQLTSRQPQAAEATWQPLERLGDEHFYVLFKSGLLALARDDFSTCVDLLNLGQVLNTVNAPLNRDMQRIVAPPASCPTCATASPAVSTVEAASEGTDHVLLNAYTGRQRH
jgi:tetratricopeptide (TPR) repeat protein